MSLLVEILGVAVVALLVSRLAPAPWRNRLLDLLKLWVTIRVFWLLLSHPVKLQDGSRVVAARLVLDTLKGLDPRTFILFCGAATLVKFVGILASMLRWQLLLRGQEIALPFRHIFGSFLIGRFIGTFLPSTAGLDGYKLYDAARFSGRSVEVTAATLLEKVIGFTGIFLSFLVAFPFGMSLFGARATLIAGVAVPFCLGLIATLLALLWFPGLIHWLLAHLPIPGKARLGGLVQRISNASGAYRDKKRLVLAAFALSFVVHFTTAAMYWFTALAIGATQAHFWPTVLGSSIQILATVLSPFTIAGEGIREAAQYMVLGHVIGPANAIVSAALGFWAAEALTLGGAWFWWFRPRDYTPAWCRVNGVQVDYEEAARAAVQLEDPEERARREDAQRPVLPLRERLRLSRGLGFGAGVLGGVVLGVGEAVVIAQGGLGDDAQVLWYAPLIGALILGAAGFAIGAALSMLPMDEDEIRGWVPSLVLLTTLLPFALFIAFFRLRRDVYLEQMPPLPVLGALLGGAALIGLLLLFAGPSIFRRLASVMRPATALMVLVAVAIAGAASARFVAVPAVPHAAAPAPGAELAERPNIILVMADTLRADHLSCYGGADPTPAICSLAENGGARFSGFGHSSWTKPATATLLTSTLPSSHGVMSKPAALPEEAQLISEVLGERGYQTGGIVTNVNLAPSFGFAQGYDEYHYLGPDYLFGATESSSKLVPYQLLRRIYFKLVPGLRVGDFYQSAETVNSVAFDFLERHKDARFFLFLHYMDPHDPYFEHPYDGKGIARAGNQDPDPSLAAEMQRLYRGEIAYLDGEFAKLLAKLRELGLWENTVIAFVSDHGEEFREHGGWWHGTTLYDEQIHVPFLLKWSRNESDAPRGDGVAVRMLDVAPTLIARSGAVTPPAMQGLDLARQLETRTPAQRLVFAEEDHEGNVLRAVRSDDWKWIEANPGNPRGLPERELFDVKADPGEKQDLHDRKPEVAAELRSHADAQERLAETQALHGGQTAELSEAELQSLKDLGYVQE